MLGIEGLTQGNGNPSQRVFTGIEDLLSLVQQPSQSATAEQGGDVHRRGAIGITHIHLAGVVGVGDDAQLLGLGIGHQRLPLSDIDIDGEIALLDGLNVDILRKLRYQLVPFVHQVIGHTPAVYPRRAGDGHVERGNLPGQAVDLGNDVGDLDIHIVAQLIHPPGHHIEPVGETLRRGQHHLPRRDG